MSANDQLPLFPEDDSGDKPSDNHTPPPTAPDKPTSSDDTGDYVWAKSLKDLFLTSTDAGRIFSIPDDYFLRWEKDGHFASLPAKKKSRAIRLFNYVHLARFLLSSAAGIYRLKVKNEIASIWWTEARPS